MLKKTNFPALLVSIDFEKVFDMIEWDTIYKALGFFKFGPYICQWITIVYTDIQSCVTNNGWKSHFFNLTRGVRQGCPLSPYLFIITVEILALYIRQNKDIDGISIGNIIYKITQYADDTCLTVPFCPQTLNEIINTFQKFESLSGLKVNYDKTEILRIGSLKDSDAELYTIKPLKWSDGPIKILGIFLTTNNEDLLSLNYQPLIDKIVNLVKLWSRRHLTIYGKVQIIKSILISQLVYRLSVLPSPDLKCMQECNNLLLSFVWNNKRPKISLFNLLADYDSGGVKMTHLPSVDKSLKISWIKRLQHFNPKAFNLAQQALRYPINVLLQGNFSVNDVACIFYKQCNRFWVDVMMSWAQLNYCVPSTYNEVVNQCLWFNSNLKIGQKLCFNKSWYDLGIIYIRDLLNEQGVFLKFQELQTKYNLTNDNFLYYGSILSVVKKTWK